MGEDRLRVRRLGLVGVGAWGRRYIDTVSRRNDCRIVSYVRGSDGDVPALPGALRCTSWTELVASAGRGEVDGIIVAATPELQAEVAEAALVAGVPVLVEKPLGSSAAAARRLLDRVRHQDRPTPVVVDYVHLWAPAYQTLRAEVVATGGAGAVATIDCQGFNRGPFRGWSSLYDYGPHDLALCFDLLGLRASFRLHDARKSPGPEGGGGELFSARFQLDDVSITVCVGNGAVGKARRFAVTMRDGRQFVYDDLKPHPNKLVCDATPIRIAETMPLDAALTYFLDRLTTKSTLSSEGSSFFLELSVRIQETLDAMHAAAAVA